VVTKTVAVKPYRRSNGSACAWKSAKPSSKVSATVRGGTEAAAASSPAVMAVKPLSAR
jgi:hypothetical protein